ncbi:MAG: hypothetical protein H6658_15355 [Ardenticatenaceae bacterium]|nr:hypothetical protein [Ardenticatenaceae bacterium]
MNQGNYSQLQKQQQGQRPFTTPTQTIIGLLLLIALIAFEIFNFDTTKFALTDFFGSTSFGGVRWASILAIAFCAIDFAGLIRFFTPERGTETPAEVWYLMGAWMLAATLNALMTWWAITLTLLNHDLGNEIMSREELLRFAPLFVAALVWLTRVLFIGAFSIAGGHIFDFGQQRPSTPPPRPKPAANDKPTAFPLDRPPLPQQTRRTPTAVYAHSRKK